MRIVLDSNILLAAFASRGLCNALFETCQDRFTVIASNFILEEVSRALLNKIKMPEENVKFIIEI
jgi:predicted nucleic acid-binding protein